MVMSQRHHESGAVSLFLVVFAMLLITIVTLSFLRVMIADQQQASVSDLSKSAYDSSLAGVEDAKRALIYYRTICNRDAAACTIAKNALDNRSCNHGLGILFPVNDDEEIPVQQSQSANDDRLNQAYTCVLITLETPDYLGTLQANNSKIIPLKADRTFSSVTIEWYSPTDVSSTSKTLDLVSDNATDTPLYLQSRWPANRPSLIRAQFMQFGSSFTLDSFDSSTLTNSNANTLFLYPTGIVGNGTANTTMNLAEQDVRKTAIGDTERVKCLTDLSAGGYACRVVVNLPQAIGQNDNNRTAYLRLTALYNATHFRISLGNNANFDGVQPSIDSTGRANEQYRRVESRVDLINTNFPFPEATVDVTGDFCKDFVVTNQASDFDNNCTP